MAAQNPSAPSPTASTGPARSRSRKPRSRAAQDSLDSRYPSATAISSLAPSGRTPTTTKQHSRSSSRRTLKCAPSTHQYT